jgi:ATP adenylyltransferase
MREKCFGFTNAKMGACKKCNGAPGFVPYTVLMDRLWTPWRYSYITGKVDGARKGVPAALAAWPGEDTGCVFCNLIRSVEWAIADGMPEEQAERHGLIVARYAGVYLCLNAFPYSSGHLLVVPYRHEDSLALLPEADAAEMMGTAQKVETMLRKVYQPDGINMGLNLGEAAGAGVAQHLHLHAVPRWFGDTNFMTVAAETRILPETLETTWRRVRDALQMTAI